jgi:hypothetical protein
MRVLAALALNLDSSPFNDLSPRTYIVLMGLGFLVGTFGHIVKSKTVVAVGIVLILFATVLLPLTAHVSR